MLDRIEVGRKKKSICVMLYGVKGIGKSSFPLESPKPIYLGSEDNSELDAAKFPQVKEWSDLEKCLSALLTQAHDFKTLVIDTIDNLQEIAEIEILKAETGKTMATAFGGYGKAYEKMANMFLQMREKYLKPLREQKGMNIILLAHAEKVKHEDPMTVTNWDNYQTAIHKKVKPIFEDWCSAILFANYLLVRSESDQGIIYAEGDGRRVIYTEERPSHIAKNRFNLPYQMPFKRNGTFALLADAIEKFYQEKGDTAEIEAEISELLDSMPEAIRPKILDSVEKSRGNKLEMTRIVDKMRGFRSN